VTNELGAAFPDAKVYGIDLTPVPALRPKLENIEYIEGNVFELTSPGVDTRIEKGSFDYVFSRFLMAGMTEWERYVKLCAALTKPGVSHLHLSPLRTRSQDHSS
jgi:2-polyprenyl-3-methyl-5-hydroxy-6-metoxy-1,4-benzoquinol methylase